jgi:VIT1/CCC1 family predicted Fe2+/Mn2+ transporter
VVYGALDGVITTTAVVMAATAAALPARIALILGAANLVADGISMGASNYLGLKSEIEQQARSLRQEAPWRHGLATLAAFAAVGSLPLVGYGIATAFGWPALPAALVLSVAGLSAAGAARAPFVRRAAWASAGEMVAVGLVASGAAYAVGALADRIAR